MCGLLPPRAAPISTMMTITLARAIIPVVSAETGTGVGTGVGVRVVPILALAMAVAVGVGVRAIRAEAKT